MTASATSASATLSHSASFRPAANAPRVEQAIRIGASLACGTRFEASWATRRPACGQPMGPPWGSSCRSLALPSDPSCRPRRPYRSRHHSPSGRQPSLAVPSSTGVGAVRNAARVSAGDAVCVVGCGGVGLQVIAGARLARADPIIAIDLMADKLELARTRGATHTVDGASADAARQVRKLSGGGVDHAFEVVGNPETIRLAWNTVKPGGTTTVVGVVPDGIDVSIDARGLLAEKTLRGSFYGSGEPAREIAQLAELIDSGGFDVAGSISHATSLTGIGDALERMRRSDGARTVVVIDDELVGPLPERLQA